MSDRAKVPGSKRRHIEKPAVPIELPSEAEVAEYLAGHAQRGAEALVAADGRPVALDCEAARKTPCWGCALDGPEKCLENHLPKQVHDTCVTEARRLYVERGKDPCHDCAFRQGSPERGEEGLLARVARQRDPFHCHQAMPLDGRGRTPADGDYAPDDHTRYPVCAGWAAAREAHLAHQAVARALPALRARVVKSTRAKVVAALGLQRFGAPRQRARVGALSRVVPSGLGLWCITQRRQAVRLAVVLVRTGVRAGPGSGGPDKPPPYTRPPPKKPPPKPKSRKPPRALPKPLMLRAA